MESTEQLASPESEVVEPSTSENEVTTDDLEGLDLGDEAQTTAPDDEEVDYEGEKYKVPAKLKDALLRQADYTRKTQEVAEQRRQIEAQAEAVNQTAQAHQQNIQAVAKLVGIDERLQQFQQLNWNALADQDPVQAQKLHIEFTNLQTQRGQIVGFLTQKQQQEHWNKQQTFAKQYQEAEAYAKREIRDWSPEKDKALEAYARAEGVDLQSLAGITVRSPAILKVIDKAAKFDQLMKNRATKPKTETQEAPVTRISGTKGAAIVNPDKLSTEQWVKWRDAQTRRK